MGFESPLEGPLGERPSMGRTKVLTDFSSQGPVKDRPIRGTAARGSFWTTTTLGSTAHLEGHEELGRVLEAQ